MKTSEFTGLEIAIIGLAGRYPGANDLDEFWLNVSGGVEGVHVYGDDELRARGVPEDMINDPRYVKSSVVFEGKELFDAGFFEYTPREAERMDPQKRLLLECSAAALQRAGYGDTRTPALTGVYAASSPNHYLINNLLSHVYGAGHADIDPFELIVGNTSDSLAMSIAYKLNLRGPAMAVHTACSSSLMTVHMACQALLCNECDMALAGGVSLDVEDRPGYLYQPGSIDSADGHCRAFDAEATGTISGSGVGVVVLKRLEDALRDGDTIHAVIRGSAANNDGADKVGYTAPSVSGQAAVIRAAQRAADVSADTISYVEAHGTGTVLGDPIEMAALTQAFRAGTDRKGYCAVGSVKTNIGHLDAAAGVTGLIKTVLALRHRTLPPSLNFSRPNPKIDFDSSPFYVNTECRPWVVPEGCPRRAGVSSFGIGGTNVHVVLEEAPQLEVEQAAQPEQECGPYALMLSARTESALRTSAEQLGAFVAAHPEVSLRDAAFTLRVGRSRFAHRAVVLASDHEEVERAVASRDPGRYVEGRVLSERPGVAFMFPGQGAQHPGMGQALYEREAVFRQEVDRCCEELEPLLGLDLRTLLFAAPEQRQQAAEMLEQTQYTQPALFVVSYAMAKWWQSQGVNPDAMLGHSIGEYVAACLAGVFGREDALRVVAARGRLLQATEPGAMLAVALPQAQLQAMNLAGCEIAAVNGQAQCVLSGAETEIDSAQKTLESAGVLVSRLKVSHAFHSHRVEPMLQAFRQVLSKVRLNTPELAFVSNVTGRWITAEEATDPEYWVRQVRGCVRFADGVAALLSRKDRVLLEVGAGEALSRLARGHEQAAGRVIVSSQLRAGAAEGQALQPLRCLAQLWVAGVAVDDAPCFRAEDGRRVPLPTYPFERQAYWIDPPAGGLFHGRVPGTRGVAPGERASAGAGSQAGAVSGSSPDDGAGAEEAGAAVDAPQQRVYARPELETPYEAPQGEAEQRVAGMLQDLLGIAQVGRNDNFFDLGGHSLLAVQLLARIRRDLGQEMDLQTLFETATVAGMAARLQTAEAADVALVAPIEVADRSEGAPLSWSQQRLWFLEQFEDLGAAYHIEGALRLEGALDEQALQRTLDRIVERHQALRTVFVKAEHDAEPVQVVKPAAGFDLAYVDLSGDAQSGNREEVLEQALNHASAQRFDLANGPLIRGVLLRLGEQEHVLFVSMHHIVSDGWSMGVLTDEVARLYAAFSQGQADPLAPLPVQYGDYAHWQRQWLSGERLDGQLGFWKEYLAGAPALLELPTDKPRPAVQSYAGEVVRTRLPAGLTAGLQGLARRHGATLFMVLQAGWALLMGRLSGQEDVVLGTPVANRRRSELEGLIGFFVNTVALRTRLDAKQSVGQLLDAVRQSTLSAYAHQDTPFEQVVEAVRPQRSLSHSPLFQVMLVLQNTPQPEVELPGLRLRGEELDRQVSQFDLSLSAFENDDGLGVELEYCTALFERETVQRWLGYWQRLLESMVADETQPVGELAWLPQAERDQVLRGFNDTAVAYPKEALIHELFEQQVKRTPEAVAVQYEDEQLTYAQLNARANRLAHRLRGLRDGAGEALVVPDARVAICVERSLEMVVGLLGILKSGAAYVPVDPEYPQDRIAYVLQDAGAKVLLTQSHLRDGLPAVEAVVSGSDGSNSGTVHVLLLDDESTYAGEPEENIGRQETGQTSGNLAYVIYTSGSTGLPKGVMNEHRGVVNRLCWMPEGFRIGVEDRVLQKTAFGFDVSVWEFFWTLLNGARLVMAQPGGHRDPQYLIRTITEQGITMVDFVPSMLQVFLDGLPQGACTSVRHVFSGGEELSLPLQRLCQQKLPASRLHHMYGPTEAAVDATHWACDATQQQGRVPIGKPIANTRIYILDGQGQPVPVGVPGEIHIAGDGVARGYLNRVELTAERFVRDPFSEDADARMYRTGDLGRWRADGAIEYLGRNDFQVKIRGLRIELGEIEAKLAEQPQVREAVVLAREDGAGDRRLVAYVTARADGASAGDAGRDAAGRDVAGGATRNTVGDAGQVLDVEALRERLKEALPGYMVPSAFVVLKEMPLTPNGKVDRKALPAPDLSALQPRVYEAPQTPTEEALASIWQELLGVERVGRNDNFFDLGGHSLLLVQLAARLKDRFDMDMELVHIFNAATLRDLASLVLEMSISEFQTSDIQKMEEELDGMTEEELLALLDEE